MFDLVIRGAMVVDGTGADRFPADVAVTDGVIRAVDHLPPDVAAARVVDGTGRVLTPGFIDIHTHSDLSLVENGLGESKVRQGVTTEVIGNCSFAPFPVEPDRLALHEDHMGGLGARVVLTWTDLAGYAQALTAAGLGINVAPLAGHGSLRVAAMGIERRTPTDDELSRMEHDLEQSLEQGAWGMSTGLTLAPSAYGQFDEIVQLAAILARRGALYATHSRGTTGITETIDLARATGGRVEQSHLAVNDPAHWGSSVQTLEQVDRARADGVDIYCDVYPYIASSSELTQYLPLWLVDGGTEAMRKRLAEPEVRSRALQDLAKGWYYGIPFLWDRFVVSSAPDGYGLGESLQTLAEREGEDPYELTLQLCERYGNNIGVVLFYRDERDVQNFLSHPLVSVGSDGNALPLDPASREHPRSYGTFPRVLGRYVRERRIMTLEQAVAKMSGDNAIRLGMTDRGTIRVGAAADLVLLDADSVTDTAQFAAPPTPPVGIDLVVVNGTVVVDGGQISAARPGKVLLRGNGR
jgi:N-acyl-D-aspartate/D-glutamate deacylase